MKIGDLVKIKFVTEGQIRRNMMSNEPVNQTGLVIEMVDNACKVMFPFKHNEVKSFLKSSLEVVSSSNEDR